MYFIIYVFRDAVILSLEQCDCIWNDKICTFKELERDKKNAKNLFGKYVFFLGV
jgi:hypothetical protein